LAPLLTPTLVTKKVIPDDWARAGVDNASKQATVIALESSFAANAICSSFVMLFRGQQAAATVGQHAHVLIIPMRARKSKRRLVISSPMVPCLRRSPHRSAHKQTYAAQQKACFGCLGF
jgi:hypothetical protein